MYPCRRWFSAYQLNQWLDGPHYLKGIKENLPVNFFIAFNFCCFWTNGHISHVCRVKSTSHKNQHSVSVLNYLQTVKNNIEFCFGSFQQHQGVLWQWWLPGSEYSNIWLRRHSWDCKEAWRNFHWLPGIMFCLHNEASFRSRPCIGHLWNEQGPRNEFFFLMFRMVYIVYVTWKSISKIVILQTLSVFSWIGIEQKGYRNQGN